MNKGSETRTNEENRLNITCMRTFIAVLLWAAIGLAANAKPHCQSINNYDGKVTIVFTDNQAGEQYTLSDVKFIPKWNGKEYPATSVKIKVADGVATVTLVFPHVIRFFNPKVTLRINGKKSKFKVCQ